VLVVLNDVHMLVFLNSLVTAIVYYTKYVKVDLFLWWNFIAKGFIFVYSGFFFNYNDSVSFCSSVKHLMMIHAADASNCRMRQYD
jgi:hypothetical protein